LSTSTTANFPFGSGPSAVGASVAAGGDSTSRAITAAWLCAISCAKVSETAEQNGQATAEAAPATVTSRITNATTMVLMPSW
jgi:hypothetical protein